MSHDATLISLAMLKVNADDRGTDYVEYLFPFTRHVLGNAQPNPVTRDNVQVLLREEFGLNIPRDVVELVLRRFHKLGWLKKNDFQYLISETLPASDIHKRREQARQEYARIVASVVNHAKEGYAIEWSSEEAAQILLNYLSRFAIESLKTFAQGTALPNTVSTTIREIFIVHDFVLRIHNSDQSLFDLFVNMIKGHMLANALVCEDLGHIGQRFAKTSFYLDTPLILRLLGVQDSARQDSVKELVALLQKLGASVAVFQHTLAEVDRVLAWYEANIENPRAQSRLMTAMRAQKIRPSDITLMRGKLTVILGSHGISVRTNPAYSNDVQIDEQALQRVLDDDISYANPRALQDDVNSIRSVYATRGGERPQVLEQAKAVLVSSNSYLARAAQQFGRSSESSSEIASVITDFSLANIAWLKSPMDAPDVPRLELLASCYAAMDPSNNLWKKYIAEAEKLRRQGSITEEDHQLLRSSLEAKEELMHLTLGAEEELFPQTVSEILDRAKAKMVSESDAALKSQRQKTEDAVSRGAMLEWRLVARDEKHARWAKRVGSFIGYGILIGLAVLFAIASVVAALYAQGPEGGRSSVVLWCIAGAIWFGLVCGFANMVWGVSIQGIARFMARFVERGVYSLLQSLG